MRTKTETGHRAIHCLKSWLIMLTRLVLLLATSVCAEKVPLPNFQDLLSNYPGYKHHGGSYRNLEFLHHLDLRNARDLLIHDTSALRLSYSLNHIGGIHSLGTELIRLSKFGHDSVQGQNQMQYIYLPIAFGPYFADKYGYPNISKLHMTDPSQTKHSFWGQQGILRVITYTEHGSRPKGHVALWDCNHFHQSKDWIAENSLLTWNSGLHQIRHVKNQISLATNRNLCCKMLMSNRIQRYNPTIKNTRLYHKMFDTGLENYENITKRTEENLGISQKPVLITSDDFQKHDKLRSSCEKV